MSAPNTAGSLRESIGRPGEHELDKKSTWNLGYWLIALLQLVLQDLWQGVSQVQTVPYSEFKKLLTQDRIADVTISERTVICRLKTAQASYTTLAAVRSIVMDGFERATIILSANRELLARGAHALLDKETPDEAAIGKLAKDLRRVDADAFASMEPAAGAAS